ncbi:MAG: CHAT domain-containing protein, partial [Terracidiphilus sp.]
ARARIAGHLESAPHDPHWLELRARAQVLEEDFDPAIDIFDRLLASGPVTPGLLADDADAYFERGQATGSENDRATALDYLRRADELAPGDPVVLFNEAIVMEDRGQVMNAVETWNRYLRFERDPQWLAEGRSRLAALEEKLNRMKTHQSRMEQQLATPQSMRALAADPDELAAVDEELSSTMLPRILYIAFPAPPDRARGSPCADNCLAARNLLHALADSLQQNHQDPWLSEFLPADSSPPSRSFSQATQALGHAIDADLLGDFPAAIQSSAQSLQLFHHLHNTAGEDRAQVERAYALQRTFHLADCNRAAQMLLHSARRFAWIQISAEIENGICDTGPGTASESIPAFGHAKDLSGSHLYKLLELRAETLLAGAAVESGDTEEAWQIDLTTARRFYAGDFPASRIFNIVGGLAELEESTPRYHLALLLEQEESQILGLMQSPELVPPERMYLAAAAIRAGAIPEAQTQLRIAQSELDASDGTRPIQGRLAENEIALANFYLGHRDLDEAAKLLDSAQGHLAGDDDFFHRRAYAAARGTLELELGHPDVAERLLRSAILEEERQAAKVSLENVVFALQNRGLYAVLAGVWLAQHRSGEDILALWERYRLRILGEPVPDCPDRGLDCLEPRLAAGLRRLGPAVLEGQVVLLDRVLFYRADAHGVVWSSAPVVRDELMAATSELERAASSPATSMDSVDQSARRVGDILFRNDSGLPAQSSQLLLEPDPLLGNLPWPAVEVGGEPIRLRFNLEETPSLLTGGQRNTSRRAVAGNPLIVGASVASGEEPPLPEALIEAREVARFVRAPDLLLAGQATEPRVAAGLVAAPAIHFAGHAVQQAGATRLLLSAGSGAVAPYLDSGILRKHPPRAARLAVFSSCSSGKREEGWNHGMGDIVNTLAALGVPEVVATRWQIDSASAVPMMDAFYDGLARGLTVPQALTLARQSLIRDPRYRHPYYWAAYYASGLGTTDLREVFHGSNK